MRLQQRAMEHKVDFGRFEQCKAISHMSNPLSNLIRAIKTLHKLLIRSTRNKELMIRP